VCRIILGFPSGATADVTASYASPNCTEAQLIGTNGIICFRDGRLEVLGPRETFDASGRFADPPVRRAEPYESEAIYGDSLAASVAAFVDGCVKRTPFPVDDFTRSIASNRLVLTLDSHRVGV
jgi:predicted dehydrogenase